MFPVPLRRCVATVPGMGDVRQCNRAWRVGEGELAHAADRDSGRLRRSRSSRSARVRRPGLFMQPVSDANGWGRDVFALAFALQNLLWGVGQPFAGAIADRFGTLRVLCGGALLYALGLVLMAYSTTPLTLQSDRRRADRLRAVGLLVQSGGRGARQAGARSYALDGLRRGNRGGFVRTISVCAARALR